MADKILEISPINYVQAVQNVPTTAIISTEDRPSANIEAHNFVIFFITVDQG